MDNKNMLLDNVPEYIDDVIGEVSGIKKFDNKKADRGKWESKFCPVLAHNAKIVVFRFNSEFNLQLSAENIDKIKKEIELKYQGEIGTSNFKYEVKN